MSLACRPEIDGLRAIAVISIILLHSGQSGAGEARFAARLLPQVPGAFR